MSWRAVKNRFKYATRDDALHHVVHGEQVAWSNEAHRIVDLAEAVDDLRWTLLMINTDTRKNPPPPHPRRRPRPGVDVGDEEGAEKITGDAMDREDWDEFWRTGVHPNGRKDQQPADGDDD